MKTVEFNGQKFDVPEWGRFLTMDDFGDVEVWNNPPKKDGKYYMPGLSTFDYEHVDW
jgi:hypothetical protein